MSWFACFELVFHRLASVATCRQTVEAFSLAQSTAWDASVATCRQTVETFSPAQSTAWDVSVATCRQTVEAFSLAQSTAWDASVATCRQTVEDFLSAVKSLPPVSASPGLSQHCLALHEYIQLLTCVDWRRRANDLVNNEQNASIHALSSAAGQGFFGDDAGVNTDKSQFDRDAIAPTHKTLSSRIGDYSARIFLVNLDSNAKWSVHS